MVALTYQRWIDLMQSVAIFTLAVYVQVLLNRTNRRP